jgi:hypothetical protein
VSQGPLDGRRLVFIAGLHRSGTDMLTTSLATHPEVSGFSGTGAPHDEGQHLQDVYPTARVHGGPGRFAFDPAAHLTETSDLVRPGAAERLFGQWSRYWDTSRPVLIEKSPPNLIRMRFLQALFPSARFIVLVRHPVPTALATTKLATTRLMRRTFRSADLGRTLEHWFAAHRILLEDLPLVRSVLVLRWEDLRDATDKTFGRIADFIGLDDAFVRPALDPSRDERYRRQWEELLQQRAGARLLRIAQAHEAEAGRFGFSMRDLTSTTGLPL